ncbi:MAG: tRNA 2-thiouridine(34) synthase MnmA [Bacteroidales bacterium]|nr:tRNA 2-thiouridine(34) synthase MnmA [Bacteroidales bacterium]
MQKSVLIAMSGGIDSSVAAYILKEQGYKVTGVNFWFFGDEKPHKELEQFCTKTGLELIFYDARELFHEEVIGYFNSYHLKGLTPSPCAHCNPNVKWKLLTDIADKYGIDHIATGHYIRIVKKGGTARIFKGSDMKKDQSYFLWNLDQDVLTRAITPLGEYLKADIKKIAKRLGFDFLNKNKESSGLCFAAGRSCSDMLMDYIPDIKDKIPKGNVLDRKGNIVGTHKGYIYYTIGQKRDLNLLTDKKLCVVEIDAGNNILIADTWQSLYIKEFVAGDTSFINPQALGTSKEIQTMVRGFGLNPSGNCTIETNGGLLKVKLDEPAWAVAPGQPVVFYNEDELLGGGIVKSKR